MVTSFQNSKASWRWFSQGKQDQLKRSEDVDFAHTYLFNEQSQAGKLNPLVRKKTETIVKAFGNGIGQKLALARSLSLSLFLSLCLSLSLSLLSPSLSLSLSLPPSLHLSPSPSLFTN